MSETYRKTLKALELELAEAEAIVERLEAAVGAVRALVGREPLKAAPRAPRAPRKPQKGIPQGPRAALGGCIQEDERFQQAERLVEPSDLRDNARALAGTQARATRDPRLIQRRRKALTR